MKTISAIIAASVLFSAAAYAEQSTTYSKTTISDQPIKENSAWSLGDKEAPYDFSTINQSPIRGAGRIMVVHNEPPVESAESKITAARWLLQDNGYQCSMPGRRR